MCNQASRRGDDRLMRLVESLFFGIEFLIFNLVLIAMLEDPFQKLIMIVFTIWIIVGAIICAIIQLRNEKKKSNEPLLTSQDS